MNEPPVQSFDDPALKAALRRALDAEGAPAGLRDRIRAAAVASDAPASPIPLRQPSPWFRYAAAAVLVLGLGTLGYQVWQIYRPAPKAANVAYAVPNSLYKAMTETHRERVTGAATPPDTVNTLSAAGTLSGATGRPTFVADLTRDGWAFKGAAVRDVGSYSAAQLFFTKDNAAVSVFSLPASAAGQTAEGTTYDTTFRGMPIAGFVSQGGLFCIVGSSTDGSLTVNEVKALLHRHRGELAKG